MRATTTSSTTLTAKCHCGSVVLTLAAAPTEVTDCNCSICRRYGVLWAYYPPASVTVTAAAGLDSYAWDDRSIAFRRCHVCGCVTHWDPIARTPDRMGINARLLDAAVLVGVRVRHLDGAVTERYVDRIRSP